MEAQWPLIIFTLFVCLGAGIFCIQGLLAVLGKGEKIQQPALIASLVSIVIGGIGSFLHLEHFDRIFNGFGHLTSGITQELIAVVVFVIVLVVYFVMMRRSESVPKWCGVLAIVISMVLVIVMSLSYNMAARPAWDTPLLWLYYLANAILFGGLAIGIIEKTDKKLIALIGLGGAALQTIASIAYAIYLNVASGSFTNVGYYFDPTQPTKEMIDPSSFMGDNMVLLIGAVIIVGAIIPLILTFLSTRNNKQLATFSAIALVAAVIGAVCMRVLLYTLGFSVFVFY